AALQAAAASEGVQVPVLIEVDVGMKRCGIAPGEPVLRLAQAIAGSPNLRFLGVMGWEGHTLAFSGDAKQEQVAGSIAKLTESVHLCRSAGIPVEIVSSSGSGTFRASAPLPGLTEVQAGGGVFSDLSYEKWGLDHEFALTILTRVVS